MSKKVTHTYKGHVDFRMMFFVIVIYTSDTHIKFGLMASPNFIYKYVNLEVYYKVSKLRGIKLAKP